MKHNFKRVEVFLLISKNQDGVQILNQQNNGESCSSIEGKQNIFMGDKQERATFDGFLRYSIENNSGTSFLIQGSPALEKRH